MVRRRRPWLNRRTGDDPDIDRINELANGLVVASLALDLGDEESARRALDEAREEASSLLNDSVVARDARERRRSISLRASGATTAAGLALVATLVIVHPATESDPSVSVAGAPDPGTTVDQVERSISAPTASPLAIQASGERLRTREAAGQGDIGGAGPPATPGTTGVDGAMSSTPATGSGDAPRSGGESASEPTAPVHRGSEASGGRAEPSAEPRGPRNGDQGPGDRRNA